MINNEKKILESELYKLSPTAQNLMKKFFEEFDKMKYILAKIQDLPHEIWRDVLDYEGFY